MSRKQRPNKAQIAERRGAILAKVPAGDVKGIWRKAVDAGLVADDENGYASVRGGLGRPASRRRRDNTIAGSGPRSLSKQIGRLDP